MNFHRNHWLLFGTIFFGFVGLAIIIAIAPAYWVQVQARPESVDEPLSTLEKQGLEVYIAEGCVACHTQQVRPLPMDAVWGRPSAARDYLDLGGPMDIWRPYTPAVQGSARIGPDLSDVGSRQPGKTWQYLHLYNPRAVVEDSIMPAYPWLFEAVSDPGDGVTVVSIPKPYAPAGGEVAPTLRGKALVAYLLSLKQAAQETTSKSPAVPEKPGPSSEQARSVDGSKLYANNCASCHQGNGQGLPGTFPPLSGDPVVTAEDPTRHIEVILNGAQGSTIGGQTYSSPMPAFGSRFSNEEIAAIVNHERTSWGNGAPTVTADDIAKQGAAGSR